MSDDASTQSRAEQRREKRRAAGHTPRRRWLWWTLAAALAALVVVSMADALGAFKSTSYTAVPHGSHDHYVPDECEDARAGDFPTRPPAEGERITCTGQIVSE